MASFEYVDTGGKTQTTDAPDATSALSAIKTAGADPHSGVMTVPATSGANTSTSGTKSTTLAEDMAKAANQNKPGYDALGNPIAGGSPLPGAIPSPSEYYSRLGSEPTPVVAKTAEDIQAEKQKGAQSLIDSINKQFDSSVAEQTKVNEGRERGTNAISTLSGLGGSSEAEVAIDKTRTQNSKEVDAINNQRAVAIQTILGKIADSAVAEAKVSRDEARQSSQDIADYRLKAQTDAVSHLTELSKANSGATLEGLKSTLNPDEYNYLVKNAGGEDMVKAILFNNRPKSTVLGTPQVMGGQMVQAFTAPDGSVKYESVALPEGVKPEQIQSVEKTDKGIFIINKDGTWKTIAGSAANPPKATESEKTATVLTSYTNAFTPGVKMSDGTPILSPSGNATYTAWKEAIKEAPTKGISRTDFIKNFGYLLEVKDGKVSDEYGLTPTEEKIVVGAQTDVANPF